jgi:hypothetical protein
MRQWLKETTRDITHPVHLPRRENPELSGAVICRTFVQYILRQISGRLDVHHGAAVSISAAFTGQLVACDNNTIMQAQTRLRRLERHST